MLDIKVIFDTTCPWCFIGKRRLERALSLRPDVRAKFTWWPFLLNKDMPTEGLDRIDYLTRKFGSKARARRVYGLIAKAGQSVGIDFNFDRISRTPNSLGSHRLIIFAERYGVASVLVERLFINYFYFGRDIGVNSVLCEIAVEVGLDMKKVEVYLNSSEDAEHVYNKNTRAHLLGVNGVPAFVFIDGMLVTGAQEPKVLARVLDAAVVNNTTH